MNLRRSLKDILTIKFDKAFGLDIGDRSIEIIELEKIFRFSAKTYGRAELPEGVVDNGRILNPTQLAERLKKLLKEAKPNKVSTNKVIVSLPGSQVFVKCFSVDIKLKSKDLIQTVIDKATLATPMDLNKTYWDFVERPLDNNTQKLIIFFSVPREIANSYVKFCNSIGLEVVSLCFESLSLARTILKKSPRQSLLIDIGSGMTNLSFFDSDDKINMSITIPLAGEHFTQAVRDKLRIEETEAEVLKVKWGFAKTKENNIRPIILPLLTEILKEAKEAIDYYEETFNQKLEDVYLLGGSALLPDIVKEVKNYLGREVQIATSNYASNLSALTGQNNYFPLFANVIGLGMLGASGEFRDTNLLRKMPAAEVNLVNRLNLFELGYLSRVRVFRTLINNRPTLFVLIILVLVILAIIVQQVFSYYGVHLSDVSVGEVLSNIFHSLGLIFVISGRAIVHFFVSIFQSLGDLMVSLKTGLISLGLMIGDSFSRLHWPEFNIPFSDWGASLSIFFKNIWSSFLGVMSQFITFLKSLFS
jgi:type IV pilus assembly protein PilM